MLLSWSVVPQPGRWFPVLYTLSLRGFWAQLPLCPQSCLWEQTTSETCVMRQSAAGPKHPETPQPATGSESPCGYCAELSCSLVTPPCGHSSPKLSGTAPPQPGPLSPPLRPTSSPLPSWGGWYSERATQLCGGWASPSPCVAFWCFTDLRPQPPHKRTKNTNDLRLADNVPISPMELDRWQTFSEELEELAHKAQVSHVSYLHIYYMYILIADKFNTHTHTHGKAEEHWAWGENRR